MQKKFIDIVKFGSLISDRDRSIEDHRYLSVIKIDRRLSIIDSLIEVYY